MEGRAPESEAEASNLDSPPLVLFVFLALLPILISFSSSGERRNWMVPDGLYRYNV